MPMAFLHGHLRRDFYFTQGQEDFKFASIPLHPPTTKVDAAIPNPSWGSREARPLRMPIAPSKRKSNAKRYRRTMQIEGGRLTGESPVKFGRIF